MLGDTGHEWERVSFVGAVTLLPFLVIGKWLGFWFQELFSIGSIWILLAIIGVFLAMYSRRVVRENLAHPARRGLGIPFGGRFIGLPSKRRGFHWHWSKDWVDFRHSSSFPGGHLGCSGGSSWWS